MRRDTEKVRAQNASNTIAPAPETSEIPTSDGSLTSFLDFITNSILKRTVYRHGCYRSSSAMTLVFFSLVISLALGCSSGEQDAKDLASVASECIWSEAYSKSPTRVSNEWLKDEVLMDFLHASNLGSENLLKEAARNEVSGYENFEDFRTAIQELANNLHSDETPERSFLEYVPHPRNRDEQGTLVVLYLHLFHCRDYWQGPEATEHPKHDDDLSDLSECYWRKVRVEKQPIPSNADLHSIQIAKRSDYVAAFQVDGMLRRNVYVFRNMTPKLQAELSATKGFCE